MAPKSKAGHSALRKTQTTKPKNSLALVTESPARPLTSFSGFEKSPQRRSNGESLGRASNVVAKDLLPPQNGSKGKTKEAELMQSSSHLSKNQLMWSDRYVPQSKAELAIHKKKIEQVEGWLREALDGQQRVRKYRRLLVLSGPTGSGKSTLIRTLSTASEMNFQILEWKSESRQNLQSVSNWDHGRERNHRNFDHSSDPSRSQDNRFSAFLSQSSRLNALQLEQETSEMEDSDIAKMTDRRIILIDDLPNLQYEPARLEFQAALERFISSPHKDDSVPVVLILSDFVPRLDDWANSNSMQGWKERNSESVSVRNVISDAVRLSPAFTHIPFNSIAMTFLRKALLTILGQEKLKSVHGFPAPSSSAAKELVDVIASMSNGDIRNAINSLQMALTSSSSLALTKGLKRTEDGKQKKGKESDRAKAKKISLATGREVSLAIFHALGKILYNKRVGDPYDEEKYDSESDEEDLQDRSKNDWLKSTLTKFVGDSTEKSHVPLPFHQQHLERRQSRVDVEKLWRTMPMDAKILQIFLHQNYTPFCGDIEQCSAFMDNLSCSDILKPQHEEWFHSSLSHHYGFLIATIGALMSLPSPVERNKDQRFRGVAFFDSSRKLRKTQESLHDVKVALHEQMMDRTTVEPFDTQRGISNSLVEVSVDQLAYEVLPLVEKIRELPEDLSDSVKFNLEIGRPFSTYPSSTNAATYQRGLEMDEDDTDIALMEEEDSLPGENPLYDEEGKRRKIEILSATEPENIKTNAERLPALIPLVNLSRGNDQSITIEGIEMSDEDEIEEFD